MAHFFVLEAKIVDIAGCVEDCVREIVEAEGVELLHVDYWPKDNSPVLRMYIDKPGGVNLSDCEKVSKHVSVVLDVEDLISQQYVLEVSSPGLERPLFKKSDYERYLDREVRLTTIEKVQSRKNFKGYIRRISDDTLDLECEGHKYEIPFELIKGAKLVYRFD